MRETWLKPNRRALAFAGVLPVCIAGIGLWLIFAVGPTSNAWLQRTGILLLLTALGLLALIVRQAIRPRIAYRTGQVLFYLRAGAPIAVPAGIVEAFFLGQGPATLPGALSEREETVNLIARLSQRETDWARQTVKPALGAWCGGYVTIRGTWCEPLGTEVVRRLNRRLHEVKANPPLSDKPSA